MVGVLSSRSYKKIKLHNVDTIIKNKIKWSKGYYNFFDTNELITNVHPNLRTIIDDICSRLDIEEPTTAYCNYWMCTPKYMEKFIPWVTETLIPAVVAHPLAKTDATYHGTLSPNKLLQLCGVPYYPHIPFVIERLTKSFFMNLQRIAENVTVPVDPIERVQCPSESS
jgi:hypothetical protein